MSDIHIYLEREQPVKVITLEPTGARGPVGPQGPAGAAGPNSVTSATTSDATCELSLESLQVGQNSVVTGSAAAAIGECTASSSYDFAAGYQNTASGGASIALGSGSTASGATSFANGGSCVASADFGHASGFRAKAIHIGASVESDSQNADVESTTTDEKTFRFLNGYRFLGGAATFAGQGCLFEQPLTANGITCSGDLSVTGTLTADHIHGNLAGSVYAHVRAGEALTKGDPVYVSGSHGTAPNLIPIVSKADASNSAKMPAIGIMDADLANNANGHMVITGTITDLDTAAYAVNDTLYVASGGGFTSTPPAANSQPVARVERSNSNNGAVIVKVNGLASSGGNGVSDANKLVRFSSTGTISVASIGGLGTGVQTALGNTTNGTGGFVTADGTATLTNKTLESATLTGTTMSRIFAMSMSQSPPCALFEDFCGSNGAGVYTWTNSGTGSDGYGSAGPLTFGVRRMTTGATSTNSRKTILPIQTASIFGTEIRSHFAIPDITSIDILIGMEELAGSFGKYFLRYSSSVNSGRWYLTTGTGSGTGNNFGTNSPSNGDFASGKRYRTIMRPINATTIYVKIEEADWNGSTWTVMHDANVTISSFTPGTSTFALDIRVVTQTSATRSLDIDYISAENQTITR